MASSSVLGPAMIWPLGAMMADQPPPSRIISGLPVRPSRSMVSASMRDCTLMTKVWPARAWCRAAASATSLKMPDCGSCDRAEMPGQAADPAERRLLHEQVGAVAATPHRALDMGRLQLAVAVGKAALIVEEQHGVVEGAALALGDTDHHIGAGPLGGGTEPVDRIAGNGDGIRVEIEEQRRAGGRSVGPDPVRIAGHKSLREGDQLGALGGGLLD